MANLRDVAARHAIQHVSLFVVDHWRIWTEGRDANGDLVLMEPYDATPDMQHGAACEASATALLRRMFPCSVETA